MSKNTLPKPPKHLSKEAKAWWKKVVEGWDVDADGQMILRQALEAFDRINEAREIIRLEGLIVTTEKSGAKHVHPAIHIEKEARGHLLAAWKQLGLDIEAPGPIGRPAGR